MGNSPSNPVVMKKVNAAKKAAALKRQTKEVEAAMSVLGELRCPNGLPGHLVREDGCWKLITPAAAAAEKEAAKAAAVEAEKRPQRHQRPMGSNTPRRPLPKHMGRIGEKVLKL